LTRAGIVTSILSNLKSKPQIQISPKIPNPHIACFSPPQARPLSIVSDLQMLHDLCDERSLMGEQGYVLTTLWCAVDYLCHLDLGTRVWRLRSERFSVKQWHGQKDSVNQKHTNQCANASINQPFPPPHTRHVFVSSIR
jgi:hypothetical protein